MYIKFVIDCGVFEENCFIMDNGEVLVLSDSEVLVVGKIFLGFVYIDGSGIGDIGNIVFCDCCILFEEGFVIVVVSINMKDFKIVVGSDIIFCGFVYMCESGDLINDV